MDDFKWFKSGVLDTAKSKLLLNTGPNSSNPSVVFPTISGLHSTPHSNLKKHSSWLRTVLSLEKVLVPTHSTINWVFWVVLCVCVCVCSIKGRQLAFCCTTLCCIMINEWTLNMCTKCTHRAGDICDLKILPVTSLTVSETALKKTEGNSGDFVHLNT